MRTRIRIRGLLAGLGLFLATLSPGCGLTGISRSQEISLGQQTAAEIERQYRTYENPTVTRIGQRLAAVSGAPDYPYRFRVIEMSEVNAFALPGGPVYVTTGLLQFAQGREEFLAAVLAHEIAHVARRHTAEQIQRQSWLGLGIEILTGGGTTRDIAILAANLESLGFSRNQERDADTYGAVYLVRAGIDPSVMVEFLRRLGAETGNGGIAFLRTHPTSENRVSRLQQQIASGEIQRLAQQTSR
ncbi:MAG TPA: M48 family metallopeptidase [Armatimonadota bacterium]|jgi:predicted Zn-dependent protease|nr:M48 family metalloprotease [Armatimonadota bacterium]HOM81212.1 M48 family metallopeptidase [Armatimonadota bacterium]HPT96700.1 M48 family metallopeptidase [Armatimonadota bacterium]